MNESTGNLFTTRCDALCITTNGFTKADGSCVMGRGCALQAAQSYPDIPARLGKLILMHGNRCMRLGHFDGREIVSFPVKPVQDICLDRQQNVVKHMRHTFQRGNKVPGWACVANAAIIQRSARELVQMADKFSWQTVILPRPGCGAGELQWEHIRPLLTPILDDRFTCMTF